MRSELHVNSPAFDSTEIAKHLQLKGILDSDGWHFPVAKSASQKSVSQQLDYWCALMTKRRDGHRALMKAGYKFKIRFYAPNPCRFDVTAEKIDALNRHAMGLEVVCDCSA